MSKWSNVHSDLLRQPQTHPGGCLLLTPHWPSQMPVWAATQNRELGAHSFPSIPTPLKINPREGARHPPNTHAPIKHKCERSCVCVCECMCLHVHTQEHMEKQERDKGSKQKVTHQA